MGVTGVIWKTDTFRRRQHHAQSQMMSLASNVMKKQSKAQGPTPAELAEAHLLRSTIKNNICQVFPPNTLHCLQCLSIPPPPPARIYVYSRQHLPPQARLGLEDWAGAAKFATEVLALDADNTKARYRRCRAYLKLNDLANAEADFAVLQDAEQSDPRSVQELLQELKKVCLTVSFVLCATSKRPKHLS